RGAHDAAFAQQGEAEVQSLRIQVDDHDARKADQAAQDAIVAEAIVLVDEVRQQYAEEGAGCIQDGRLDARGVAEADVEEYVLQGRLGEAQQGQLAQAPSAQAGDAASSEAAHEQQHQAGQKKAIAGKYHLAGDVVRGDGEKLVAILDGGVGAAPQHAAQGGHQHDHLAVAENAGIHARSGKTTQNN